jgi:hypothetical protein
MLQISRRVQRNDKHILQKKQLQRSFRNSFLWVSLLGMNVTSYSTGNSFIKDKHPKTETHSFYFHLCPFPAMKKVQWNPTESKHSNEQTEQFQSFKLFCNSPPHSKVKNGNVELCLHPPCLYGGSSIKTGANLIFT